jgi:phage shock protein A
MSLIRRITATVSSHVDRAVSRVENHDAIVEAALRDTRQAASRARVRLKRLQRDGARLQQRHDALGTAIERWSERARAVASDDEAKALACVRRRRDCEQQRAALATAIANHAALEQRMAEQVRQIEGRVEEVMRQRNEMRSRQSVVEALRAVEHMDDGTRIDLEETFDRWEIQLGESEILADATSPVDVLESEFLAEEDNAALRAELEILLAGSTEGTS